MWNVFAWTFEDEERLILFLKKSAILTYITLYIEEGGLLYTLEVAQPAKNCRGPKEAEIRKRPELMKLRSAVVRETDVVEGNVSAPTPTSRP